MLTPIEGGGRGIRNGLPEVIKGGLTVISETGACGLAGHGLTNELRPKF